LVHRQVWGPAGLCFCVIRPPWAVTKLLPPGSAVQTIMAVRFLLHFLKNVPRAFN